MNLDVWEVQKVGDCCTKGLKLEIIKEELLLGKDFTYIFVVFDGISEGISFKCFPVQWQYTSDP